MAVRIVVCDTGPLIAFALLDLLPVLPELFSEVIAPPAVVAEATRDLIRPGAKAIDAAIRAGYVSPRAVTLNDAYEALALVLDIGEAEALAVAEELGAIALIDERRGRKVALKRGIAVTGTAAVLITAKRRKMVGAVKPLLEKLSSSGCRLSPKLVDEVIRLAGEV